MKAWDNLVESPSKESHVNLVQHLRDVCKKFPKFLTYVESNLFQIKKDEKFESNPLASNIFFKKI